MTEGIRMERNSYALKSDQGNGIFHTWTDCQAAMKGRTNIRHKAFANDDMCRAWLAGKRPVVQPIAEEAGLVTIYTDGSYDGDIPSYGWGFAAILEDGDEPQIFTDFGAGQTPDLLSQRNVAGEMVAAMKAVQWAAHRGYRVVELRYDYSGVGGWPTGRQRVSGDNIYAGLYRDWMQKMMKAMDIRFVQIPGHSGDWYNEKADELAKMGCRA